MYGNGHASIRIHSTGRVRINFLRQSTSSASKHDRDEDRPEPHHHVVREIEELDVVGPSSRGKSSRPFTVAPNEPYARRLSAPAPRSDCRCAGVDVGLADERDLGVRARLELLPPSPRARRADARRRASHCDRRWEIAAETRDHPGDYADAQRDVRLLLVLAEQLPIRADGRHHERARDHGGAHRVRVLPDRPRVQQVGPRRRRLERTATV